MKHWGKALSAVLRVGIGVGIVIALLYRVNESSQTVDFTLAPTTVPAGTTYETDAIPGVQFLVLSDTIDGTRLHTLAPLKRGTTVPQAGLLHRAAGEGPHDLAWTATVAHPHGLHRLGEAFREAGRHPGLLAAAVALFGVCLTLCAIRWRLILDAQGLHLGLARTWSVFFIGHFFNAFMFGATGGDVVKAYYAARETGHRKAEAVSTVFIDRLVGLVALVLLATVMMGVRFDLYRATTAGRSALALIGALALASILGFITLFATRRLADSSAAGGRWRQLIARVHGTFYVCLTHPSLMARTFALSVVNHVLLVCIMVMLARALDIHQPFEDFLALTPTINTIGAVPITPGGLGLREFAAVTYLGLVGIPATQALPLSLSIYTTMLLWSLAGGVVFLLYTGGTGLKDVKQASGQPG